jgi:hypothetical protein
MLASDFLPRKVKARARDMLLDLRLLEEAVGSVSESGFGRGSRPESLLSREKSLITVVSHV